MQACTNVQFIVSNYINAIISYCVKKNNIHTKNMSIILVNFYLQLYKKKINDWKKIFGLLSHFHYISSATALFLQNGSA